MFSLHFTVVRVRSHVLNGLLNTNAAGERCWSVPIIHARWLDGTSQVAIPGKLAWQ
jgi:hypothetical protein